MMTDNLDPQTATRAALAEEIDRLRAELEHAKAALAGDNEGIRLWMLDCGLSAQNAREQRDEARRDLTAATTTLATVRKTLATVRKTLATVRAERDHAFLLLRVLRHYERIPDGPISRQVNACVALESESDIQDAHREVDQWITEQMEKLS